MKTLYKHQQDFIGRNPDKALLVWETQTGKTVGATLWINARSNLNVLVVCPKGIVGKWKRDLEDDGAVADVCTRDEIKKINLDKYDALVLDEAQDFASPLFDKTRSKRAEVVYNYVRKHPHAPILLLTATPVRSTPWNIHTLACYLGKYWDKREFRNKFFYMTDKYGRFHYEKVDGWRKMLRPYIEEIADIVLMSDVTDVPIQHHQKISIKWTQKLQNQLELQQYEEPSAEWHSRHRAEQSVDKWKTLEKITNGYRKIIVVCHYLEQIDDYMKRIGDNREVYVLRGSTKDQDQLIEDAKASDDCIFIIQAQMGAGFSASEFSAVVFASMPFSYVHYRQMLGRTKVITNLHENTFYYLLGGKCDKAVYNTIYAGQNFDPITYLAGTSEKDKKNRGKNNSEGNGVAEEELPF